MKKILSSLLTSLVLSGCALFHGTPTNVLTSKTIEEKVLPDAPSVPASSHGIEVTWEIPTEPVDGFIIRYGDSPTSLAKEVTLSTSDIREEKDPEHGPVYRYLIRDVEESRRLFVSIAAVKGQTVSNFSEALEAQPER